MSKTRLTKTIQENEGSEGAEDNTSNKRKQFQIF